MSTSTESCHDLDMADPEVRENVYSSDSSYSTYSREVKYIFNPEDDSVDQYGDYSHINPCSKQNYMSYTPHARSTSSQVLGKENRTPLHLRNDYPYDSQPHGASLRTGSVHSNASRDRGPITTHIEGGYYSPTHYGYAPRKHSAPQDNISKDKNFFSSGGEITSYPYARHSIQVWKNNNNVPIPLHHQNVQKQQASAHQDVLSRQNRNHGPVLNSFQTQHTLTSHYQHPGSQQQQHHQHPVGGEPSYHQHPQNHHSHASHEPPYPMPPRYNHQHHARRKTWSPPTLKMSLMNASSQGSRVCYSNDSLDISEEAGLERKTQSLSEDLDVTPPKLAPISGVLAQKPGPNLIRPIAFKPVQAGPSSHSPADRMARRQPETGDFSSGAHDTTRPQMMKLDPNSLSIQGSPYSQNGRSNVGAFSSMAKPQNHNSGSSSSHMPVSCEHAPGSTCHPHPLHNHFASTNSSHSSLQHNSSINSHHNISNNTYCNVPAISTNSSNISACNETGFSSDISRTSEGPESVQPMSVLRVSFHAAEGALQTPSPSDSGVGELEAMLREKDAEMNTLREVMDRNERAIFQVYEEKKNSWLHDTQEIQNDYERKLKVQTRKAYKTEQVLSLQVYKLQQDQKTMQEEKAKVTNERDTLKQQAEDNQNEIAQLKLSLETALTGGRNSVISKSVNDEKLVEGSADEKLVESSADEKDKNKKDNMSLQEELALKNKELIILKGKLYSFQTDTEKKNRELADKVREVSAKVEEVKSLKDELTRLRNPPVLVEVSSQTHVPSEVTTSENIKPSMLGDRDRIISGLQEELSQIQAQVVLLKEEHEKERKQWLDEKNRVVRYQKQLQLNYVQMQRKNVTLETEVQQLTLELESRDMKLIALTGEESVC